MYNELDNNADINCSPRIWSSDVGEGCGGENPTIELFASAYCIASYLPLSSHRNLKRQVFLSLVCKSQTRN